MLYLFTFICSYKSAKLLKSLSRFGRLTVNKPMEWTGHIVMTDWQSRTIWSSLPKLHAVVVVVVVIMYTLGSRHSAHCTIIHFHRADAIIHSTINLLPSAVNSASCCSQPLAAAAAAAGAINPSLTSSTHPARANSTPNLLKQSRADCRTSWEKSKVWPGAAIWYRSL